MTQTFAELMERLGAPPPAGSSDNNIPQSTAKKVAFVETPLVHGMSAVEGHADLSPFG